MKSSSIKAIAAAMVATIVISVSLCGCKGRRASDMVPTGETVEVNIDRPVESTDSANLSLTHPSDL